jgi:hypothetical protein
MKTKDKKKPPLLLEGELLLEKVSRMAEAEIKISILDVTHIDAESVTLAESIEVLTLKKNQTRIPFIIFGTAPEPSISYIVVASISVQNENREKITLYRTTQSIPVFRDRFPDTVMIPLTKIN